MKKYIALLLTFIMCFSLCACSSESKGAITIESPVSIQMTPSLPVEDETIIAYTYDGEPMDLLTIEEVSLKRQVIYHQFIGSDEDANFFTWSMKVRNTSGADLPMKESSMRIFYQYLDENMDVLYNSSITGGYSNTIKAGRSEKIEENSTPGSWGKNDLEAVVYLEIYGYTTTLHGSPDHEFAEPILINVKECLGY